MMVELMVVALVMIELLVLELLVLELMTVRLDAGRHELCPAKPHTSQPPSSHLVNDTHRPARLKTPSTVQRQ